MRHASCSAIDPQLDIFLDLFSTIFSRACDLTRQLPLKQGLVNNLTENSPSLMLPVFSAITYSSSCSGDVILTIFQSLKFLLNPLFPFQSPCNCNLRINCQIEEIYKVVYQRTIFRPFIQPQSDDFTISNCDIIKSKN